MNRIFASLILLCASFFVALQSASAVTISWVPVGNPGNAADGRNRLHLGAVPYEYSISKYDVTNAQYAEFLNTKDPSGANKLGLWNSNMGSQPYGGISFKNGNVNGSKYVPIAGREMHPVTWVGWYEAIRFSNWLNNGQGNGSTETGAYTLLGGTPTPSNGNSITRNPGATVFLPSENEWYKAAYYNPSTGMYFEYPTSNDTAPTGEAPPGGSNSANFNLLIGATDVGAYTLTKSPYGAFDMGGNVWQWNEDKFVRGGSFNNSNAGFQQASLTGVTQDVTAGNFDTGFRVASVPEPSTGVLVVAACGLMWVLRKRFK